MIASSLTNILASIRILGGTSEVVVVSFWEWVLGSLVELIFHLLDLLLVELHVRRLQGGGLHQHQICIVDESSQQPYEWLLELVVALG